MRIASGVSVVAAHGDVSRRGRRGHGTEPIGATRRDAEIDRAARIVVVRDAGRYSGA